MLLALMLLLLGCGGAEDGQQAQSTTTSTELVLPISNEACLSCHEDFEQRTADEDRKEFSHELHLAQLISCETCHAPLGHTGAPLPDSQVCDDCHGVPMPHPEGYETSHGAEVVANGDEACANCHNIYLHCQTCHGVQMPHPDQWEQKHGEIAWPEMQTCSTCHETEFCLTCHPVEMPHPQDWTKTHGLPVVEQGSDMCTACHEPELCTSCHGMAMPHPDDWGTQHPQVAQEKREECMICHVQEDCDVCHEIHQTHGQGGA
jgi:hypothetical protein